MIVSDDLRSARAYNPGAGRAEVSSLCAAGDLGRAAARSDLPRMTAAQSAEESALNGLPCGQLASKPGSA